VVQPGFAASDSLQRSTLHLPLTFLADLWKEYSKADSRYATRDAFVVQMEAWTAFVWGPLALLGARGLLQGADWAAPSVLAVSAGQLYGTWLYFATAFHGSFPGSPADVRPEPLYTVFYFWFMNIWWILIPLHTSWAMLARLAPTTVWAPPLVAAPAAPTAAAPSRRLAPRARSTTPRAARQPHAARPPRVAHTPSPPRTRGPSERKPTAKALALEGAGGGSSPALTPAAKAAPAARRRATRKH